MKRLSLALTATSACLVVALCARVAEATAVQDLVRIKGHERNVLVGMGLVVGLDGTGDTSGDSLVAARPYAALLENLANPVADLEELAEADAYAIVAVTMEIPATGVREGDRLKVSVDKLFNAKSLEGGRLLVSPLRLPGPDDPDAPTLAFAEGSLVLQGDDSGSGVIREGGQMLRDIRTSVVTPGGRLTLVLKDQYAGYPVATTLADAINEEFAIAGHSDIARAEDAKNIRIHLPPADQENPAAFISVLMTIPLDPSLIRTRARIVINEKAGIIAVTGNVDLGPVGITHKGMQLTNISDAEPVVAPTGDAADGTRWRGLDTTDGASRSSTRLLELLRAFDQLSVPVPDQIAIIHELKKTGALHAEIVSE